MTESKGIFSRSELQTYGTTRKDNHEYPGIPLTQEKANGIIERFATILEINELIDLVNKIVLSSNHYDILIVDGKIVKDISFNRNSIKISYTEKAASGALLFMSDIKIELNLEFQLINASKEIVNKNIITKQTIFALDNNDAKESLDNLYVQIERAHVTGNPKISWWNSSTFDYLKNDEYKIFEMYYDKTRSWRLKDHYRSDKFKDTLNTLQKGNADWFVDSEFIVENLIIANETLISQVDLKQGQSRYYGFDESENDLLHQPIFSQLKELDGPINFVNLGVQKVNLELFSLLNATIRTPILDYQKNLKDHFSNEVFEEDRFTELFERDNFMNGSVALQNPQFKITDDYSITLNTVIMNWILAVSGEKFDGTAQLNRTSIGTAIYYNVISGIRGFHNIFGVKPSTKEINYTVDNVEKKQKVFLTATGNDNRESNFWNLFGTSNFVVGNTSSGVKLNNILSLRNDSLSNKRHLLLTAGYQGIFDLSMNVVDANNDQIIPHPTFNHWYSVKHVPERQEIVHSNSFFNLKLAFHIKLNFINIYFILQYTSSNLSEPERAKMFYISRV
ncbi:hypothetical protein [Spiroplasma clarkii]|uniref:Uncharacterized protein n=2 Tax=Spiroplasma clarkii TaxID=2139 RepID=A0A2K8KIX2_9MOLU|nr:hypothetical protein [Spiroplasma clarkii]ATX71628.1 hypothetical protein SCLAR_v1c13300 [Spiroplasma clarkii]